MYRIITSYSETKQKWSYTIFKDLKHFKTSKVIYDTDDEAYLAAEFYIANN